MLTLRLNRRIEESKTMLIKFAFKFTNDPDEADELVQETLIRSINYQDELLNSPKFGSWLYVIMKNIYINNYRKAQRRFQYEKAQVADTKDQGYNEPFTYNKADDKFTATDIQIAMKKLATDTYDIFNMYIEGYKYREIADHYNMPEGTIKTRIHHARKFLRKQLSAYDRAS